MDLSGILNELIKAVLLAVVPIVGLLLGRLLKKGISQIDNQSLQTFAWMAVRFAEDKLVGPGQGKAKLEVASQWLAARFPKLDPSTIEAAVRASYQQFATQLGNGAGSPSTP
jgi:hypothetical protein